MCNGPYHSDVFSLQQMPTQYTYWRETRSSQLKKIKWEICREACSSAMTHQRKHYTGRRMASNDICKGIFTWGDEVIFTPVFILVALDIEEKYIFFWCNDYCYGSYSRLSRTVFLLLILVSRLWYPFVPPI